MLGVVVAVCAVCGCECGCAVGKLFSFEVGCRYKCGLGHRGSGCGYVCGYGSGDGCAEEYRCCSG